MVERTVVSILLLLTAAPHFSAAQKTQDEFTARLPDRTTVELVGLRYYSIRDLEQFKDQDWPWWRPDGSPLAVAPDKRKSRTSQSDSYLFVINIKAVGDFSCKAVGPWNADLTVQPVTSKGQGFEKEDLRRFTLRFASEQKEATIRVGLATGDWKVVDRWSLPPRSTPYNMSFGSSEQVVLRCPEQKDSDVVAEITQTIRDDATRLVLFDKDGGLHKSLRSQGGSGKALVRYIHRFKDLDRNNIEHIEFQKRPYEYWITFNNVSLYPGQKTKVEVEVEQVGSLVGKPLPELRDLKTDLSPDDLKAKMILVCFFDMNQRPSRRCVTQLAKQAKQLKQKGITIVAVQASKVNENTLNEWVKENNIRFALGMIRADVEKTRFAWGVQSLPWLILTDAEQIVRAEGFGFEELDEKLNGIETSLNAATDLGKVTILVKDQQGKALPNVPVTEFVTGKEYKTDATGKFVCKSSDKRRYFYAVDKQHKLAEAEGLDAGQRQLEIMMVPARLVSGRVVDPDNKPVAGAQVAALPMTCFYVLSDNEGKFDVGWSPSWEPSGGLCLMARHQERNLATVVDITRDTKSIDIKLEPALTLKGKVINTEDKPIPGAKLGLIFRKWRWGCATPVKDVVTDDKGCFRFDVLPQLQNYEFRVSADGYLVEEFTTDTINTIKDLEEVKSIVLYEKDSLGGEKTVSGRLFINVVDENRKPVDITSVQIWKKKPGGGSEANSFTVISTDKPGFYEIDDIPVGKYRAISVQEEGFAPFWKFDIVVEQDTKDVITCILSRGGTIEGFVTDEQGKPVKGIPVVVNSILCRRDVKTDENGHFTARNLPDIRYSIIAEPESNSPYEAKVLKGGASCGAKDLHILLKRKKESRLAASLMGKHLSDLNELKLHIDSEQIKDKAILVCFWDMNQRPSRNCIIELAKQAEQLKQKGVAIIAVQATKTIENKLTEWVKKQNIPFPVGTIEHDVEKTRFAWGVQSLPWLILTDEEHIVWTEGFALSELNDRIDEVRDSTY